MPGRTRLFLVLSLGLGSPCVLSSPLAEARWWRSGGRTLACHAGGPGLIPGQCDRKPKLPAAPPPAHCSNLLPKRLQTNSDQDPRRGRASRAPSPGTRKPKPPPHDVPPSLSPLLNHTGGISTLRVSQSTSLPHLQSGGSSNGGSPGSPLNPTGQQTRPHTATALPTGATTRSGLGVPPLDWGVEGCRVGH